MDSAPALDAGTGVARGDGEVGIVACPIRGLVDGEQPAPASVCGTCEETESVHSAAPSPSERAAKYREQGQYESAATIYRALVESLDDNMELVDGAYDHFSGVFTDALDGYVDSVVDADLDRDTVDETVAFPEERATSGTPSLRDYFEQAAGELRERTR